MRALAPSDVGESTSKRRIPLAATRVPFQRWLYEDASLIVTPRVVAPRHQRMKPPAALEVARRVLFVAVRVDQRRVDADHDGAAEVAVAGGRGRDRTMPGRDRLPHLRPDPVAHHGDRGDV